jgi:hypothetical protein
MFGTWVALEEAVNERNETMEGNKKLEYGWYAHCVRVNTEILKWQELLLEGD